MSPSKISSRQLLMLGLVTTILLCTVTLLLLHQLLETSAIAIGVTVYLAICAAGISITSAWLRNLGRPLKRSLLCPLYWLGFWHAGVLVMSAVGGFIGAVLFPLIGSLLQLDYSLIEMLKFGIRDGSFYAFIWAPGVIFVFAILRANRPGK